MGNFYQECCSVPQPLGYPSFVQSTVLSWKQQSPIPWWSLVLLLVRVQNKSCNGLRIWLFGMGTTSIPIPSHHRFKLYSYSSIEFLLYSANEQMNGILLRGLKDLQALCFYSIITNACMHSSTLRPILVIFWTFVTTTADGQFVFWLSLFLLFLFFVYGVVYTD